jgi:hypothetical protein
MFRTRNRELEAVAGSNRLTGPQVWDKRGTVNVLFISSDPVSARDFGIFIKPRGINANYAWSLEGLDFLPLTSVNLAVIAGDCWRQHEIFGRPVSLTLQSFPKIIVLLKGDEAVPGGKQIQENVEYVHSVEEMQAAVAAYASNAKKEADPLPDFVHH